MEYFVYILLSENSGRYYIGSTSDIAARLARHNAGATPSTKPYRPWKVVYSEIHPNKTEALKRENYIKKMKSREFIESLLARCSTG
jgi:putative endonuclease